MRRGPRYEAKKAGLKRYFTGKCARGHVCERLVSNTRCVECNKLVAEDFRHNNREKTREYVRRNRQNNPQRRVELERKYHKKHKAKRNTYSRNYSKRNRKKMNAYMVEWRRRHTMTLSKYDKFAALLRTRLRTALKGLRPPGSAVRDLGCSIEFFKEYIAAKFSQEMNWDNHGKVWQLDHITPLCEFDLNERGQLLKACHFSNLQPLSIAAHRQKTSMEATRRRIS